MCIRFNGIIFLIIILLVPTTFLAAKDFSAYKKTCKEIGFNAETEKFRKCVVKLIKKDRTIKKKLEAIKTKEREQLEERKRDEGEREREERGRREG